MAIRVGGQRYDLVAILPSGERLSLRTALQGLQYEEQQGEFSVRVSATLRNVQTRYGQLHRVIALATRLILYVDWGEGWKQAWIGKVIDWSFSAKGTFSIVAYDDLFDMLHSQDQYIFGGGEPGIDILRTIFVDWGVPLGLIQGPYTPMPTLRLSGKLGDHISTVITETFYAEKKDEDAEFLVRARVEEGSNVVDVIRPGTNLPIYHITPDLVIDYTDEESISDLVTEVQISGENDEGGRGHIPATSTDAGDNVRQALSELVVTDDPTMLRFGRRRALVNAQENDKPEELARKAYNILAEHGEPRRIRSLTCPDIPQLRRGDFIHVTVGTVDARLVVAGIQHDADTKQMTITFDSSGTFKHRTRRGEKGDSARFFPPAEAAQAP